MKRWIAMLLTVCMLVSLCPVGVFAEPAGTETGTVQQEGAVAAADATGATGTAETPKKTEPAKATEGTKASEPTTATEGTKASEPTTATEGTKASEPTTATEGTEASEPTKAAEAQGDAEPTTEPEQPEAEGDGEEPACICETVCPDGAPNINCPVCRESELYCWLHDWGGEAADPNCGCTCELKCTEGAPNTECDVCKEYPEKCAGDATVVATGDTYEFYVDGEKLDAWTQVAEAGKTLKLPGTPVSGDKKFLYWAVNGQSFDGYVATVSGVTVRVDAVFETIGVVQFWNADASAVLHTVTGKQGDTVDSGDMSYATGIVESGLEKTEGVLGWSLTPGGDTVDSLAFNDGIQQLYPRISTGYWVSFDTDGGNYIDPVFQMGGTLDLSAYVPTKAGFVFRGWSVNGSQVSSVSDAATVTAQWEAGKDTEYLVIYWTENADDDDYSFAKSETLKGTTGQSTNAKAKKMDGFTAQPIQQETIRGDGSTIVNVRYKRNVYTVKFYSFGDWYNSPSEYVQCRITAKFGANISDKWPTVRTEWGTSSTWSTSSREGQGPYQVNIDTMPFEGAVFYGPKIDRGSETAYYYVEALPGEAGDENVGGIRYKLHHSDTSPGTGYYVTEEDKYAITGFTFKDLTADTGRGGSKKYNNARFYYTRNSYSIVFINGGAKEATISKKYEESLSGVSREPNSVPDGMKFLGWYDNEYGQGQPYVFDGKTMPAQNITLYACFTPITHTVTVHVEGEDSIVITVPYGTAVSEDPEFQTLGEHSWYVITASGRAPFNPDTKITRDMVIYAYNKDTKDTRTVTYRIGEKSYQDTALYEKGSVATVKAPAAADIPAGKIFKGWLLDGTLLNPGQTITVNENVTLEAQLDDAPTYTIEVVYNWRGAEVGGETVSGEYTVGTAVTVTANVPDGYSLMGQSSKPVNVQGGENKVIFYVYKNVTLTANSGTFDYDGTTKTVTGFTVSDPEATFRNCTKISASASGIEAGSYPVDFVPGAVGCTSDDGRYIVTSTNPGTLTIQPSAAEVTVVVKGNAETRTYDGQDHTVSGFTIVSATDGRLTASDIRYTGSTASATGKDAGSYTYALKAEDFSCANGNFTNVTFVVQAGGSLTIAPVAIELTANSASKVYDRTALTDGGYQITKGAFVGDEGLASVTVEGSQTEVGSSANTISSHTLKANTKAGNYTITYKPGTLAITQADELVVTITGNTDTVTYNGSEQSVRGYTTSVEGRQDVTVELTKEAIAKGTNVGTYYMGLKAEDFQVTAPGYKKVTVKYTDGWLKIKPNDAKVTVTINGNTASRTYTGSEQSVSGYTVNVGNKPITVTLKDGAKAEAKGTNVGKYNMGLTKEDFDVTSANYSNIEVIVNDGWLEITPVKEEITVTVTGNRATKVYSGSEQTVEGYTTDVGSKPITVALKDGAKAEAKRTDVGTTYMGLTADSFTVTSENYSNIKVVVNDGWLKIMPDDAKVTVTINGNTGTKTYNGSEQSVSGYTVNVGNKPITVALKDGAKAEAKGTNVGKYNMGLTKENFDVISANYSNIEVIVNDGWLEITPVKEEITVTVTGNHDTKVYSGSEQTVEGYTTDVGNKPITVALKNGAKAEAKRTGVGTTYMGLTADSFTVASENYSNIKVVVNDGWLEITPVKEEITVTVTGNHDTKVYSGSEQTVEGYTTDVGNKPITVALKDGAKAEAKRTDVGTTYMGLTADSFTVTSENYSNIKVIVNDGWLEITPVKEEITVTVTGNRATKIYSGSEQTVEGYTTDVGSKLITVALKNGAKAEAKRTDVGTTYMGLTADSFTVTSENYSNIKVIVNDGWLEITPVKEEVTVTITGNTGTEVYSGTEQSVSGYTVDVGGKPITVALNNDAKAEAKGTNVGKYYMNLTADSFTVSSANYTNIKVVVNDGWLEITPVKEEVTVTITGDTGTEVYNGTEQSVSGYSVSSDNSLYTANDFTFTGIAVASGTDANRYSMGLKAEDFTNGNDNFTNVTFVVNDGWLEISPVAIELTANSASKVYDSTALTDGGYTITKGAFVGDEGLASVTVEGSQTEVGSSANTISSHTLKANTKAGNYAITYKPGTLAVTPADELVVTIIGNTDTVTYNGSEQSVRGYTTSVEGRQDVTVELTKDAIAKGTNVGTYYMGLKAEDFQVTAPGYKKVTVKYTDGWLKINPEPNPGPGPEPGPGPGPGPQPGPDPEPEPQPEPQPQPEPEPQPQPTQAPAVEDIVDEPTPLAMGGAWALVNLILTVLTVLGSVLLLIGYIGKKQKEREDENGNVILNAEGEAEMDDVKKKGGWRLASILPAVGAVIAFILTENMRLPMVLVDKWTLLMIVIALVQLLVAYFSRKKTQEPEQPEQMQTANA